MLSGQGLEGKIVNSLRIWSTDSRLKDKVIYIPEGCEDMGFLEGYYDAGSLLHFIADMLE